MPVNATAEIDGTRCCPSIGEVEPAVEGILVMTAPRTTGREMEECVTTGIRHVWLFRGMGVGAVSDKAVAYGESHGVTVVAGNCPFMFLPGTGAAHRLHGWSSSG